MANRKIKIFGIGGCGNNMVKHALDHSKEDVEYYFANTESATLNSFDKDKIIPLGNPEVRKGSGAGNDPIKGKEYALESKKEISEKMNGADIVILAAGMGKGTGSGASAIFAEEAKKHNALTIAVVTTPFEYEGKKTASNALLGISNLKKYVDGLVLISNNKLIGKNPDLPIFDTLKIANVFFEKVINVIYEIIHVRGIQNVDFADLLSTMKTRGEIVINSVKGFGNDKVQKSLDKLLEFDILENNIKKAKSIILNITSSDITSSQISEIINRIKKESENDIDVIYGLVQKPTNDKELSLSIIATGITNFNINTTNLINNSVLEQKVNVNNNFETKNVNLENTKNIINNYSDIKNNRFNSNNVTEKVGNIEEKNQVLNNNQNNYNQMNVNFRSENNIHASHIKNSQNIQNNHSFNNIPKSEQNLAPKPEYNKLISRINENLHSHFQSENDTKIENLSPIGKVTREESIRYSNQKNNNFSGNFNIDSPKFLDLDEDDFNDTDENDFNFD
ncbi:cell division protein FtsZ [[Mycoplasma] collis]|uniref:cell division protein FtsZ n=1 Tax=[Mycoplasma] collis TaxID=2127 RepID=UPI00051C0556|nr:cell division protein FtsZ [[Mycoplasma] collis]